MSTKARNEGFCAGFYTMGSFELHFNPPLSKKKRKFGQATTFDSFVYEPENTHEEKLGYLYMVGHLPKLPSQNHRLLDNLSSIIKARYYRFDSPSAKTGLKESLKRANQFLSNLAQKGNLGWLGNLNFGVISIVPPKSEQGKYELYFSKQGNLKILLLRGKKIIDMDQGLPEQKIEPYSLEPFGNVAAGELIKGDRILVLTKDIATVFTSQNLISQIAKLPFLNKKNLTKILKERKKRLLEEEGVCLLIDCNMSSLKKPQMIAIASKKRVKIPLLTLSAASLTKIVLRIIQWINATSLLAKITKKITGILNSLGEKLYTLIEKIFSKLNPASFFRRKWQREKQAEFEPQQQQPRYQIIKRTFFKKKNTILITALVIILLAGFLASEIEKQKNIKLASKALNKITAEVQHAENALIFKNKQQANILFQKSWQEILPLTKEQAPLGHKALKIKKSIQSHLAVLNNLKIIDHPQPIFTLQKANFIPKKIINTDSTIYLVSPHSATICTLEITKTATTFIDLPEGTENAILATPFLNQILFFTKSNKLLSLEQEEWVASETLKQPYPDSKFATMSSFKSNIYFLDYVRNEIVKYSRLANYNWSLPKLWLNPKSKTATKFKSMAVDGNIWLLNNDNSISRWYGGVLQETLHFNSLFPPIKNITKIWTSPELDRLYLLEPQQQRVIIVTKGGKIIKQFQSPEFNNLLDFSVSRDGQKIYLLNNPKIYLINLGY